MAKGPDKTDTRTTLSDGEIIDRFGGIRPMAAKLGVAFTTVQGWKVRGHIPENRRQAILDAAAKHGIDLGRTAAKPAAPEPSAKPAAVAENVPAAPRPAPEPPREAPPPEPPPAAAEPEPETPAEKPAEEPAAKPEPQPQPSPPPAAAQAQPSRGVGVAWLALLVALAVGAALAARPWWEPLVYPAIVPPAARAPSAETLAEIRALSQSVDRLSGDLASRLEALEGRIAVVEQAGGGNGELGPQLAALERSLTSLSSGLDTIGATLAALEARIVALESASQGVPPEVASALAALKEETAALDSHLTASRADTEQVLEGVNAGLAAAMESQAALGERVEELESRPVQTGERVAALVLAVGQVEAAFNSGKPYREALDRLEAIARDDPLVVQSDFIAALSPWADYGVPTRAALQRRFAEIAPDITAALARIDSKTWLDRIWDSLASVVTVRRVEGGEELSPVSRAEAALAADDLEAAVAALTGQGSLGDDGNAWLNLAENRVRAEAEFAQLYGQLIAPLAGSGGAAPAAGSGESATQ